jgi:glycosyltransferase involved in cell wall biosynthesis
VSLEVIHCADYGAPYAGSFVPLLVATARELASRGHHMQVVFSDVARDRPWLSALDDVAQVSFLPTGGSRRAFIGNTMRKLEADLSSHSGPAVIHTHFATFDIPAALMRLRRRRVAVIWHEHGPLVDDDLIRLRNSVRYITFGRLVRGMLCVSQELAQGLLARHAPAGRLYDFPNAIDTNTFAPITTSARNVARSSLGLSADARVVLHLGWDWERKGGDVMLEAAATFADEPNVVVLTVLGEHDGAPPGVDNAGNVWALPPTDDMKQLYAAADVFLSCSRAEGGLPLAAIEALACGLPLVLSSIPVNTRLVGAFPGVAAVVSDQDGIAAGLREMLAVTEDQRARSVSLTKARFEAMFSLDSWAQRLVDFYEQTFYPRL